MNVKLKDDLENLLREMAKSESLSIEELVDRIVREYVDSMEEAPVAWVQATQQHLPQIWPVEDFSDWNPPDAQ